MPAMDQRELDSYVKQLNKCIVANEAPENALRLLETLKKDAAPTEEMLRVRSALVHVAPTFFAIAPVLTHSFFS
jgi:transcription elongation factor S-II